MSNGARLTAVIVVVAVAAIGLYFAMTSPTQPTPAAEALTQPAAAEGLGELAGVSSTTTAPSAPTPPADAFGTPSNDLGTASATLAGAKAADAGMSAGGAPTGSAAKASIGGASASPSGARPTGDVVGTGTVTPLDSSAPNTWKSAPQASATKDYVIKSGDTLEAIARAELGSGQKWQAIVAANPGLDPKALKIGQRIRIPDAGTASAPATPTETMKSASSAGSANTCTVQRGDTLFGIARKIYGSGSEADVKRIVEANSGTLKSKDTPLKPGMKLAVPAKR